jgi:hypothetical protein
MVTNLAQQMHLVRVYDVRLNDCKLPSRSNGAIYGRFTEVATSMCINHPAMTSGKECQVAPRAASVSEVFAQHL